MFPAGIFSQDEELPRFWKSYCLGTFLNALSSGTEAQFNQAAALLGAESHVYFAPDENLLSGMGFARAGNEGVVAFQGTRNVRQAIAEVMLSPQVAFDGIPGKIHGFFGANFQDRWTALGPTLATLPAGFKLTFIGHSLGGALAHIGFVKASVGGSIVPASCITFGQPRAGNAYFASKTPMNYIRWNQEGDVITGLPPNKMTSWFLIGPLAATLTGYSYLHARVGNRLNNNGTYQRGNTWIQDDWGPPEPNDFIRLRTCYSSCYNSHVMGRYLVCLHNLITVQGSPVMIQPFVELNEAIPV